MTKKIYRLEKGFFELLVYAEIGELLLNVISILVYRFVALFELISHAHLQNLVLYLFHLDREVFSVGIGVILLVILQYVFYYPPVRWVVELLWVQYVVNVL